MPRLVNLITNIEDANGVVNVDNFLEENGLGRNSSMASLFFDKKVFKTEVEVAEYLNGHHLDMSVTEIDGVFVSVQIDPTQFMTQVKRVTIRRGVEADVGVLILDAAPTDTFSFSLGNTLDIKFKDGEGGKPAKVKTVIEVARTVKGFHPDFGEVEITKDMLKSFIKNFNSKSFGKDIVWDFDHEEREASGWPTQLFLSEKGDRLLSVVNWTPKGFDALSNREFRYFSPQYKDDYIDPQGEHFGPTIIGGGITNKPFLNMKALVSLSNKKQGVETMAADITLSMHNEAISKKDTEIAELKLSNKNSETAKEASEGRVKVLEAENKTMKDETQLSLKKGKFEKMLSEKTACEAQRESYMSGDLEGFAENAVQLNSGSGTGGEGGGNGEGEFKLSDADKKMADDSGISHDDYMKHNKMGKYKG